MHKRVSQTLPKALYPLDAMLIRYCVRSLGDAGVREG